MTSCDVIGGKSAGEQVQPISAEMGGGERTFSRLTLVPSGDGMCDVWQWWETRISPARRPSDGKKIDSLWCKIDVSIDDSLRTDQYHTQYHKLTSEKEAPFLGRFSLWYRVWWGIWRGLFAKRSNITAQYRNSINWRNESKLSPP